MFAIEVEFLTGRLVATDRTDRDRPEWPPHPGRLFSALTAAAFECFSDAGELETDVCGALEWLEEQPPPSLSLSTAEFRETVPVFVPVNDSAVPTRVPKSGFSHSQVAEGLRVLPERRSRQKRSFPSVTPHIPFVHFVWPNADAGAHRPALEKVVASVTYLGHSSTLVRATVVDTHPALTHQPDDEGEIVLRVPTPGRLGRLAQAYRRQSRPSPGTYCSYTKVGKPGCVEYQSIFGDALVFRCTVGRLLPLRAAHKLAIAVRNALIALSGPDVPEVISGHASDGGLSRQPHLAIVPLANIGHFYADGSILGFAIVVPRQLRPFSAERQVVVRAAAQLHKLWEASSWRLEVRPLKASEMLKSLQFVEFYGIARPARTWASVTPIVCDRHPKEKDAENLRAIITDSCARIGLPPPIRIEAGVASPFRGVPPSCHFFGYKRGDPRGGHRVHALIEFEAPVRGPIILGKNRHLGLGLMRPYSAPRGGGA